MKIPLRTRLQQLIIRAIIDEPAESVSELARRVHVSRPTASRAVSALIEAGFLRRDGRRLTATPAGEEWAYGDVVRQARRLAETVNSAGNIAAIGLSAAKTAHAMSGSLASMPDPFGGAHRTLGSLVASGLSVAVMDKFRVLNAGAAAAFSANQGRTVGDLMTALSRPSVDVSNVAVSAIPSLTVGDLAAKMLRLGWDDAKPTKFQFAGLGDAITSVIKAQEFQVQSIAAGSATSGWWTASVAETMPNMSRMLSDLTAIRSLAASDAAVRRFGGPLGVAAASLARLGSIHLTEGVGALPVAPPIRARRAIAGVVLPVGGSAAAVHSARRLLDADDEDDRADPGPTTRDVLRRLRAIDPELAELLEGAWDRLTSQGPDWARSTAHQARELLAQVLERLTPDAPSNEGRPTRTTRVKHLYARSGSTGDWADAHAEYIDRTYALLSAEAHTRDKRRFDKVAMGACLRSVEMHVLLMIETAEVDDG